MPIGLIEQKPQNVESLTDSEKVRRQTIQTSPAVDFFAPSLPYNSIIIMRLFPSQSFHHVVASRRGCCETCFATKAVCLENTLHKTILLNRGNAFCE